MSLFISIGSLQSQSLLRELVVSQTSHLEQSDIRIMHAVGQPVTGLFNGSDLQLSAGVYQALDMSVLSVEDVDFTVVSFYPNPTSKSYRVHSQLNKQNLELRIFNSNGSIILEQTVSDGEEIDVEYFAPGIYLLKLYSNHSKTRNIYKLIKNKSCPDTIKFYFSF